MTQIHKPAHNDPEGKWPNVYCPPVGKVVHLGVVRAVYPFYMGGKVENWLVPACAVGKKKNVRAFAGTDDQVTCSGCLRVSEKIAARIESKRENPSLLILSNPTTVPGEAQARAAWEKFHLKGGKNARVIQIPDVPGLPKTAVVLGAFEGIEWVERRDDIGHDSITVPRSNEKGPWLVTDISSRRLWIVATSVGQLADFPKDGFVKAVYYYPGKASGKYDRTRAFRHEYGEGGPLPKDRWHEVYPRLTPRSSRAFEFTDGQFEVESRGIVG